MDKYIILVTKCDTNERYIYNLDIVIVENETYNIEKILDYLHVSNPYLKYEKTGNEYIVYESINTIRKGWVWNTIIDKKDIKYKLELIPVIQSNGCIKRNESKGNEVEVEIVWGWPVKEVEKHDIKEKCEKPQLDQLTVELKEKCEKTQLDQLTVELKEMLVKPNYGLRKRK